jgi:paraquat-inducible protein A
LFTLLLLPILRLAPVLAAPVAKRASSSFGLRHWLRWAQASSAWSMIEVYVLGALIAIFRLRVWVHVELGPGLLAMFGVAACTVLLDSTGLRRALWREFEMVGTFENLPGTRRGCARCGLPLPPSLARCPRCGARPPDAGADPRRARQRCWALVVAAALLLVPANALPVLDIHKLGEGGPSTILGGCHELVKRGLWPLAAIVFVASLVVPVAKLALLAALMVLAERRSAWRLALRARAFRLVAAIGRWSMLDIFAGMTLMALARFGWLGEVKAEPGLSAFCAAVVLTLFAAEAYEPRDAWLAVSERDRS